MKSFGRTITSAVLLIVSAVMLPLTLIQIWVSTTFLDTPRFVENYRPLSTNPDFQEALANAAGAATLDSINDNKITGGIAGFVDYLNIPNFNTATLDTQVKSLALDAFNSSAFPQTWDQIVTELHTEVLSALANSSQDQVTVQVQIAPLVNLLRTTLVEQGIPLAKLIPDLNHEVNFFRLSNLNQVRPIYDFVANNSWVPVLNAALLLGGILVAKKRWFALGWAGVATLVACLATYLFSTQNRLLEKADTLSLAGVNAIWDTTVAPLQHLAMIVGIGGLIALLFGFLIGIVRTKVASSS